MISQTYLCLFIFLSKMWLKKYLLSQKINGTVSRQCTSIYCSLLNSVRASGPLFICLSRTWCMSSQLSLWKHPYRLDADKYNNTFSLIYYKYIQQQHLFADHILFCWILYSLLYSPLMYMSIMIVNYVGKASSFARQI